MTMQYTPSNGSEGDAFESKFCRRCACDDDDAVMDGESTGCPILSNALAGGKPSQWVQDHDGPRCTAFVERTGPGVLDPYRAAADRARYDAMPRDPVTGRPVIA